MMTRNPYQKLLTKSFFLLLVILVCACKPSERQVSQEDQYYTEGSYARSTFSVDPIFLEFYEFLGGESTLGPAISPLQESGNLKTQYVEAALMVYDPMAVEGERYRLAPLGLNFGIAEPPIPDPKQPELRYINGHIIDPIFLPYYEKLGGARYVGRPITEVRHNPEKGRVEQYFENLGFYRLEQDASNQVFLLAYGAFACGQHCRYQPVTASIPSQKPLLPEPFASAAANLGLSFVGRTLTDPYVNPEGNVEVIFENIVLVSSPLDTTSRSQPIPRIWIPIVLQQQKAFQESTQITFTLWLPRVVMAVSESFHKGRIPLEVKVLLPIVLGSKIPYQESQIEQQLKVSARPIVEMLNIAAQPPVPPYNDPIMTFYSADGRLGYNIPKYFMAYIERHGGLQISGPPITEVFAVSDGKFRQCFKNICLDYDIKAPEDARLRPAPLGTVYKERFYHPAGGFEHTQSIQDIRIQTWESKSFVASNEPQEIHVGVFEGNTPLRNREPILILTMPDNSQQQKTFPPTDHSGHTYLKIPAIDAPNGTLIAYKVCLSGFDHEVQCVGDNYLIWNYP